MSLPDRIELLRTVDLFRGLPDDELRELAEACHVRELAEREELCHQGDDGREIYLILEGQIAAMTTGPDGADVIYSVMRRGQLCGELALFTEGKRTATMRARSAAELLVIERRSLVPFLKRHPDAALEIISVLARRVARLSQRVADASFMNVPSRLAKSLIQIMHEEGRQIGDEIVIEGYSQRDLGQMVMATRESVNKTLRLWAKAEIVSMKNGLITIHDADALTDEIEG